ncbi:MAG: LysM peptidoglycan-binding domain-containing protein, partial [Chloroflexota bacterium]|nr:LysM peptidoglycan-binding domain-containing protein [Chloroflexota bacterium]
MVRRTLKVLVVTLGAAALVVPPGVEAAPDVHVVEAGETLWRIAREAGTDAATLARLNNLADGDVLRTGQSLQLPVAARPSGTYVVAQGDTLSSIAQQLGTTTMALVQANALEDADRLSVGATLKLPAAGVAVAAAATPPAPTPAGAERVVAATAGGGKR